MSRSLVVGFAAALALGAASLASVAPAAAQSWSVTIGSGGYGHHDGFRHGYRPVRPDHWRGGWGHDGWARGGWGHQGWGGHGGWRERRVFNDGFGHSRCVVRKVRYWDGFSWVVERRRVCH
jgi:hypothetical protein